MLGKYNARVDTINSLVCVGLDSEFAKIPEKFRSQELPQSAFNQWIIDQTHPYASAYKMNTAFYEARGDQGIRELKATTDFLRASHPDILLIGDGKRADIGNTNQGYVEFLFDWLGFDAVTIHPYLGNEAMAPFLERADRGSIILCRTSNPGAGEFQDLLIDGKPLWQHVAENVRDTWNMNQNCLLVVGATYPEELRTLRQLMGDMTFLVPGVGAQGGDVQSIVGAGLNAQRKGMIINSSRGIIFSDDPALEAKKLRDEINQYR